MMGSRRENEKSNAYAPISGAAQHEPRKGLYTTTQIQRRDAREIGQRRGRQGAPTLESLTKSGATKLVLCNMQPSCTGRIKREQAKATRGTTEQARSACKPLADGSRAPRGRLARACRSLLIWRPRGRDPRGLIVKACRSLLNPRPRPMPAAGRAILLAPRLLAYASPFIAGTGFDRCRPTS